MDSARLGPYNYVLTAQELESVRRRARRRWRASGGATLSWGPTILALLVIFGLWLWLATSGAVSPSASQFALMFAVAAFFTGKWLHQWEIERAYARVEADWSARELAEGPQRSVAIEDAFVAVERHTHKAQIGWDNFTGVEDSAGLVWLWMSNFQSVVVAARAFPDAERRAAFVSFARAKIKPAGA
jgi:hypothetical protein